MWEMGAPEFPAKGDWMNCLRKFKLILMIGLLVSLIVGCSNYAQPTALQRELIPPPMNSTHIVELRPDVVKTLNSIKQLMIDPSTLLNRQRTLSLFDVQVIRARKIVRDDNSIVTEDVFTATKGLFANAAWSGGYNFRQSEPCAAGCKSFLVQVEIFVNHKSECVSSQTVHAYLNTPFELQPLPYGVSSESNIYEKGSFKLMSQIKNPGLEMGFTDGCLNFLSVGNLFNYLEHSDVLIGVTY
jgi:hypothetical protein